jgi:hypothetical protein
MDEFSKIWERIKYENELVDHRLTWLGTFQGLLLAALAFAWDKRDTKWMIYALAFLGLAVALSIAVGTCRANRALRSLSQYWDSVKPKGYVGLDVEGVRSHRGFFWWLMPGSFVPLAFAVAWLFILYIHFRR